MYNNNNDILELCGQVESVVYRNEENGYTVIELIGEDEMITAVGTMPIFPTKSCVSCAR